MTPANNSPAAVACMRSHLAIVSATQSNIGTKYHRQNDAKRAMGWYLESIRTRATFYQLPGHDYSQPAPAPAQLADVNNANNKNCNQDGANDDLPPSPRHPKRPRVNNQSNTSSHGGTTSLQHDQRPATTTGTGTGTAPGTTYTTCADSADDELACLLVKYLYEATAIEAIEADAAPTGTTASATTDATPFSQDPTTIATDAGVADTSSMDISQRPSTDDHDGNSADSSDSDHEGDDYDDDYDYDYDDDNASFDSSPLSEDEEEELSSFLQTNDDIVSFNDLSHDTTGRFIGLNHFTSPITIDLSNGMTATGHQQERHDGDNDNSSAYMHYECDIDAHAAITLFNMSLLHQQDGTDLASCRRFLEVGLHVLTQQSSPSFAATASSTTSPLHTCLFIMLHTNLGYISYVTDDNDAALKHFTMAFSVVSRAVERTYKEIESAEKGSGKQSNEYLQSKRACHYYYCRAEVAALINVTRSCEAIGLYEIALRTGTSAIQRLHSNPSLLDGDDLPTGHPASEEEITLTNVLGSADNDASVTTSSLDLHSATFVIASIHSQLANDEEALRCYVTYFHHVTDRHGPDHSHAIAAILGINLIQLLTRGRMSLAAGAA